MKGRYPSYFKAPWLILSIAICFIADQFTKASVKQMLPLGKTRPVTSFLTLVHTWNSGISFGFFPCRSSTSRHFLLGIIVMLIGLLLVWCWQARTKLQQMALVAIIGGALSNAYDRFVFGSVFDFLRFHWGEWHFPAFNLADMLITIGFLALMKDHFQWKS